MNFNRFGRLVSVLLLSAAITGCACRTKKVGPEENIPVASEGGVLGDVNFAFDRSDLTDTAKQILARNGDWLKANPSARTQIEGHCDERGTEEYNMALGWKRANSAQGYLRGLGVVAGRMSTISYGENLPLDPGHDEVAWAKNRRAHFKVEGK